MVGNKMIYCYSYSVRFSSRDDTIEFRHGVIHSNVIISNSRDYEDIMEHIQIKLGFSLDICSNWVVFSFNLVGSVADPKEVTSNIKPEKGDMWWVSICGNNSLQTAHVLNITKLVVSLKSQLGDYTYSLDNVIFVEKIIDQQENCL